VQALNWKGMGSGYFAPSTCDPGYISASVLAAKMGGLPLVMGMTVFGGLFEAVLSRVIQRTRRVFTTEVTGLVVAMMGISIIPIGLRNFLGVTEGSATFNPAVLIISCLTLATMAAITVWSKGRFRLYSVIIGMGVGYLLSYFAGLIPAQSIEHVLNKPFFGIPHFGMLSWSFDASLIVPFLVASLCTSLKSMGNLITCQKINDADWTAPDMSNTRKGLLADGVGVGISGLLGGMGQSTASSNIGLAMGTGATSRQLALPTGCIMISLAFLPQLTEVFVIMPQPVLGATPLFATCFIILTGFQIMLSRMIDPRKMFIIGFSMIFGIGSITLQPVFSEIQNPYIMPIMTSPLYLSTILAICLTTIFRIRNVKRCQEIVEAGVTTYDDIREFMERQGGIWGARQEVINRSISALHELLELIAALNLTQKPMLLNMTHDEYSMDFTLEYEGKLLDLTQDHSAASALDEDITVARLSLLLIRKNVDGISSSGKGDRQRILLHFDH
jgi:xanthine permease XanP